MSETFHTSDQHLFHPRVSTIRGFTTVEEHNDAIATRWCELVGKRDHVWVHGDVTAGSPGVLNDALTLIASLPGTKHLITGNHDQCHPMYRDAHRWQRRYLEAFESVQPFARRKIGAHRVLLSHFPYTRDRGDTARHMQYRLRNEGLWLIHGHTHGKETVTTRPGSPTFGGKSWLTPPTKEFHVGVDAWALAPVHSDVILATIDTIETVGLGMRLA